MADTSPSSLVTRIAFGAQTAKGTYPTTSIQAARGMSVESVPNFDLIENENHMIGVHERSTAAQSVAERSSVSVPIDLELGLYPLSLPHLLFGIGFVPGTPTGIAPAFTHKLVKSNMGDAPYETVYLRMGSGSGKFSRQIQDVRLSQLVMTLNRQNGATARVTGMGLNETVVEEADYTVSAEDDTMFMPFLGGFLWDLTVGSDYDFGMGREHVITFDRPIETDDQQLHTYERNDNREMSFGLSGVIRGLEFGVNLYNELVYGGLASVYDASLGVASVLTGFTLELNTSQNIPTGASPYKYIINVPKAEIRLMNFRAQGNEIVRAEVQWRMIDDATTPPVRIELLNNVASYPHNNTLFVNAGGTAWTLPDATP